MACCGNRKNRVFPWQSTPGAPLIFNIFGPSTPLEIVPAELIESYLAAPAPVNP